MDIEEIKIYKFCFRFEHLEFKFDITAKTQEEAVFILKKCLTTILGDLNMHHPSTEPPIKKK